MTTPLTSGGLRPHICPPPSSDLADWIVDFAGAHDLPVWNLDFDTDFRDLYGGELVVPRVPSFPGWEPEPGVPVLRPRVERALETLHPFFANALTDTDWAAIDRMQLAALRDVIGVPASDLATAAGVLTGNFHEPDLASLGRMLRDGRKTLRRIGAWPWMALPLGATGNVDTRGWRASGDDSAASVLRYWTSPDDVYASPVAPNATRAA